MLITSRERAFSPARTLSGQCLGQRFCCVETIGEIDDALIFSLLKGGQESPCVIYVARSVIPPSVCTKFAQNFWAQCERAGGNRDDYVEATQIGANQWGKSTPEYFDQVEQTRTAVEALFAGLDAQERELILRERMLEEACQSRSREFRAATFQGSKVSPCTARYWRTCGELSLLAHEDLAQLRRARVDSFEIGRVRHVVSANACLLSGSGGRIVIWDIAPDARSRMNLGISDTGYPYPLACLEGFNWLEIALAAGDLFFLRSEFVHAVTAVSAGQRITAGRFMGFVDDQTLVYWT